MASDSINPLGTTVETGELADNAVTLAKLAGGTAGKLIGFDSGGDPAELGNTWALQEVQTASSDTSLTFSTLPDKKLWLLILDIDSCGSTAGDNFLLRINGDTGSNYQSIQLSGTTLSTVTTTGALLGILLNNAGVVAGVVGMAFIQNSQGGSATKSLIKQCTRSGSDYSAVGGEWASNATITSLTILGASGTAFSGKAALYYNADMA